jgi:hypothetical protein
MRLKDIIEIADRAYDGNGTEHSILRLYEMRNRPVAERSAEVGDTLAIFIAKELEENCEDAESYTQDSEALGYALSLMETARDELCDVCDALENERLRAIVDEEWARRNPGVDPTDNRI